MANGSSIINTSPSGLPVELEDRAYSFCIGTQIFQNPSQEPRNAVFSFKVDPQMLDAIVENDVVGSTAIGLATADNISTVSTWQSAAEIRDNGVGFGIYPVSFAENSMDGTKVNVCCAGNTITQEEFLNDIIQNCSWWQVIALALLDLGPVKVAAIF